MPYKIEFTKRALDEIAAAYDWYELQAIGLGDKFVEQLDKFIKKIATNPTHYGFIDETKTVRDLLMKSFPYQIVYQIFENSILIHSVFQAQQHPNKKIKK